EVRLEPNRGVRRRKIEAVEQSVDLAHIREQERIGVEEDEPFLIDCGDAGDLQLERIAYLLTEASDPVKAVGTDVVRSDQNYPAPGNVTPAACRRESGFADIFLAGCNIDERQLSHGRPCIWRTATARITIPRHLSQNAEAVSTRGYAVQTALLARPAKS